MTLITCKKSIINILDNIINNNSINLKNLKFNRKYGLRFYSLILLHSI